MFEAGPTKRKTKIAPGLKPFKSKLAASGVEEVAQTYVGKETKRITIIDSNSPRFNLEKKLSGTSTATSPPIKYPTSNNLEMSLSSTIYAL